MTEDVIQKVKQAGKWYRYCKRKGPYSVYPMELLDRGICENQQSRCKMAVDVLYDNGWIEVYYGQEDFDLLNKLMFEKVLRDERFAAEMLLEFKKRIRSLFKIGKELQGSRLSDKRVAAELLKEFHSEYIEGVSSGVMSWWGAREPLLKLLEDYLFSEADRKLVGEYLSTLSSPLEPSFVFQEKTSLLNIVQKIQQDVNLLKLFKQESPSQITKQLKGEVQEALKQHIKEFEWIPFDYNGPLLYDEVHFIKEIKEVLVGDNVKDAINRHKNHFAKLKQKQQELSGQLGIDEKHKRLFSDLQTLILHQDAHKEYHTKAHLILWRFLQELAKQRKVIPKDLTYLTSQEIEEYVVADKLDQALINKRKKFCVNVVFPKRAEVFVDDEALVIAEIVERNQDKEEIEVNKNVDVIKGQIASSGKAQGVVKVILDSDKVNTMISKGVLVTGMTTPVFVPAMKKAAAIVTDEGGITCHAAIVSRELGIPCIIGTKIATQVLKDNDMVEVDADKGVVKILK